MAIDCTKERQMKKPAVLISHPTGNQNVRNALRSLAENGMLAEFWTAIAWNSESFWSRLLPLALRNQLARRAFTEAPWEQVQMRSAEGGGPLSARPAFVRNLLCSGERPFSIIGMYRHFDSKVARRVRTLHPDAVYAYEGGALETFREARRLGIKTIYELTSSYWYWVRRLLTRGSGAQPRICGASTQPFRFESTFGVEGRRACFGRLCFCAERARSADFDGRRP